MTRVWRRSLFTAVWMGVVFCLWMQVRAASPQEDKTGKPQAETASAPSAAAPGPFYLHAFHAKGLGFDCSTCHVPAKEGSVVFQRPGHEQCMACHSDAFGDNLNKKICEQCHTAFPPTSTEDLLPFPRYKGKRAILTEFSHAKHVDPQGRVDSHTGFRGDCTFCHKFDAQGAYGNFPAHAECSSCHSKAGMKPQLSAASTTGDCRTCHNPEEIENPGSTGQRRTLALHVVSGKYEDMKFSHVAHFKHREEYGLNCLTCHSDVMKSTGLANLSLPKMVDCIQCHDMQKNMASQVRLTNCQTCHVDKAAGPAPGSHTRWVKPAFHTEVFRQHHESEASAEGAKCFVCHTNVVVKNTASSASSIQCLSCHVVMRPASHTARWRDDVHGKYAAIDREGCANCHATDYCSRCHNELPRSHVPLALFKGGAHARLAMLNERSCLTCHTFQNTCAECHTSNLK